MVTIRGWVVGRQVFITATLFSTAGQVASLTKFPESGGEALLGEGEVGRWAHTWYVGLIDAYD